MKRQKRQNLLLHLFIFFVFLTSYIKVHKEPKFRPASEIMSIWTHSKTQETIKAGVIVVLDREGLRSAETPKAALRPRRKGKKIYKENTPGKIKIPKKSRFAYKTPTPDQMGFYGGRIRSRQAGRRNPQLIRPI